MPARCLHTDECADASPKEVEMRTPPCWGHIIFIPVARAHCCRQSQPWCLVSPLSGTAICLRSRRA